MGLGAQEMRPYVRGVATMDRALRGRPCLPLCILADMSIVVEIKTLLCM